MKNQDIEEAARVFDIEARAILDLKNKTGDNFVNAIDLLLSCKGKVVVTGMGKSGIIGRKIASTFSSTGTPAIYVHPAESSHGDLGMISKGDVILAISYSGDTAELSHILAYAARKDITILALTGKSKSSLAQASRVVIDVSVKEEACPIGLAPTASTTSTLAMGDALAVALMKRRGFKAEEFAEYHPSGTLGARLLTRVKDVMHKGESVALVKKGENMKTVISKMTAKEVRGVAGVIDDNEALIGIITDGDLRRRLDKSQNPLDDKASDIMSNQPKTIDQEEMAERALYVMEQFAIQSLFVVNKDSAQPSKPVGLLHFHDLLKSKVR
jgi:arabinose-5-phosphate isomerase